MCSVFFFIIFHSPFRDGFFGKTKQKTTESSTHFRSGYGSDWIGSVLVLVFCYYCCSVPNAQSQWAIYNTLEQTEFHFVPLAMWFMKSWYNFRPVALVFIGLFREFVMSTTSSFVRSFSLYRCPCCHWLCGEWKKSLSNRPAIQRIYGRAFKLAANFKQNIHTWPHREIEEESEQWKERKQSKTKKKVILIYISPM